MNRVQRQLLEYLIDGMSLSEQDALLRYVEQKYSALRVADLTRQAAQVVALEDEKVDAMRKFNDECA